MPLVMNVAQGNHRDGWAAVESAPLFRDVSQEDFRRISAAARLKRLTRGDTLYWEGDTVNQVFLLISGFVKMSQLGSNGVEVILRLGTPGEVLGAERLFSTGRHSTTAQAIRGCGALVWDAAVFKAQVERLPVLHQNMMQSTCGYLQELEERFRELATEQVASRIVRQLIRLQAQAGSPEIGLSQEGLAQMTGTTVYTVSRLLSAWKARGLVNSRRQAVVISDAQSLHRVLQQES